VKAIADRPTREMYASGLEIDCQCARCGSSVEGEHCGACEDGFVDRYEEDPLWYGHELYPCDECGGRGVFHRCCSSPEWCEAHPLPGREGVGRGRVEWFTIEDGP
jgi:hypothetical protein